MKWLGQHIIDLVARFRSDVYLDSPTAGGSDPDKFLGIDSNNKIVYRTGTEVLSDIGAGTGTVSFDGSSANGILTYKDADEATVESTCTYDGTDLKLTSTTASKPVVQITNTHTTPTSSGELQFKKDAADTEDGENLGKITFYGEDEGNNNTQFAQIHAEISESDETDEAGKLILSVAESDGTTTHLTQGLILEGEHATDGQVDVTIGAGALSTTTVAGVLRPKGQIQVVTCNFKDNNGTDAIWVPLGSPPEERDSTNMTNEQSCMIMPCDGYVKEVIIRAAYQNYTSEDISIGVWRRPKNKKMNGQTQIGGTTEIAAPTQNSTDDNTATTGDLGTTYAYSKYDAIGIKLQWESTGPNHTSATDKTFVTVVFEHDLTSLSY